MSVEVEMYIRITLQHLTEILYDLQRIHHTQRIRQHKTLNFKLSHRPFGRSGFSLSTLSAVLRHSLVQRKGVHQLIDILWRVLHTIRPILQIKIDTESLLNSILHLTTDVTDVHFRGFSQLLGTVFQRTLGQQVDDPPATFLNPVDRLSAIHKSQHFDTLQQPHLLGKSTYSGNGLPLAF